MRRRQFAAALGLAPAILSQPRKAPPNIIWITGEDMGPALNCYGFSGTRTPHLDRLAAEGVKFTRAFATAPVCSSSRSGFMTGAHQIRTGAHHHRSHRRDNFQLLAGARLVTDRLREQGYFTCNVLEIAPGVRGTGKTDLNFTAPKPFDGTHWSQRRPNQPFFAHINFQAPHKGPAFAEARKQAKLANPATLELPPYWPDHPVVRDEYANFLDAINLLDTQIGVTLEALRKDNLLENSVIAFFGDNGRCLIRGKQWLYDAGIQVPLIVRWPGAGLKAGSERDDIVTLLDVTATTLDCAGVDVTAARLDGSPLFGPKHVQREHAFVARDRCDMTLDRIRAVRTVQYKYIRNFMPERPYTQFNAYIEKSYPTLGVMKNLHSEGKLNATQQLFMAARKPAEELYDVIADPHEVRNLAQSPRHRQPLAELRGAMDEWLDKIDDQGRFPEKPEAQAL